MKPNIVTGTESIIEKTNMNHVDQNKGKDVI